jgi:hypothetical protein
MTQQVRVGLFAISTSKMYDQAKYIKFNFKE